MEATITKTKTFPETETSKVTSDFELYFSEPNLEVTSKKEKQTNLKNTTDFSDSKNSIIAEYFKTKGFIGNECWEKTLNISSRIASFNNDYVLCECLIDKENKIFEKRSFPRYLFNHIEDIKNNPYVILSIQSKIGSTRIDVIKGANLVDKKLFDLKDEWAKFEGSDFNQPLDKPIQL